ncbi:Copper amine oxidase N-terminal domain-containing protein [Desulfotomaculum arcticum]|uniref:Copper amine oxidase N-terminal domain-containing protein n=1 Tax=Desulfotruncus arcticus DSM 17038 TaxID=1121424 RepID=A0A1I2RGR1_9FIRM|nr:stalk domain-containing protein [Desulfotruncus arcticus]SFG39864.1 Copper amine oxidase N-terminal domain-containing protein [Desulfotomaculum arcticum] [Desulfotruncus arcticus DSM 17038]
MKWAKLLVIISMLIFLIIAPGSARALKNQIQSGANPATPKPVTVFYDGVDITGQITLSPNDGIIYIPMPIIIDQLKDTQVKTSSNASKCTITTGTTVINFSFNSPRVRVDEVELELMSGPWLNDQIIYVPLEFIQNVLGCPVKEYTQSAIIAIFSCPIIQGDYKENNLITDKLQNYLSTNLYNLSKDDSELHKRFTKIIHPDDIDVFCQNLSATINTPTSWGAIEFMESRVVARTTDAAVVYYKVRYTDGSSEETVDGLWGLQKYHDDWFIRWN